MMQKENHMYVWKTSLLKLCCAHMSNNISKLFMFVNIIKKLLHFEIKHPSDQIGSISCCLTWKQFSLYFRCIWINCDSHKEISSFEMTIDGKCILTKLYHIASASTKGRR